MMTCLQTWLSVILDLLVSVLVAVLTIVVVVLTPEGQSLAIMGLSLLSGVDLNTGLN